MQHIFDRIDAAVVLEGEVLVIQYHPFLTLLAGETLDVGEHAHRHQHLAAISKIDGHHATFLPEVELLDSKFGVFIFANIIALKLLQIYIKIPNYTQTYECLTLMTVNWPLIIR